MRLLLSNSQVGPDRTDKQEQEEISRNNIQAFIPGSVQSPATKAFSRLHDPLRASHATYEKHILPDSVRAYLDGLALIWGRIKCT